MENYTTNWQNQPENIIINNLSSDNNEFYDTSNILTSHYLDMEIKFYKKYPLEIYIYNKEQSRLLQEQILQKDIISKDEYEKLSSLDKKLYVINEQRTYQTHYDNGYSTEIINYIKKSVKDVRDRIIKEEQKRKKLEEISKILSKTTIYHHEYNQLNSEKKGLYSGIKATQTEWTRYREGPNYFELYGKNIISYFEYNLLSVDEQRYYIPINTETSFWSIFKRSNYKLNQ